MAGVGRGRTGKINKHYRLFDVIHTARPCTRARSHALIRPRIPQSRLLLLTDRRTKCFQNNLIFRPLCKYVFLGQTYSAFEKKMFIVIARTAVVSYKHLDLPFNTLKRDNYFKWNLFIQSVFVRSSVASAEVLFKCSVSDFLHGCSPYYLSVIRKTER